MLQRDYPDQVCSIARSLEVIGERWTLLIVRDAVLGIERFEDFQADLGIATNVLTNRLKRLCDEDVLRRVPDPERPGRPKYVLTEKGSELGPVLIVLMKWGTVTTPPPAVHPGSRSTLDAAGTSAPTSGATGAASRRSPVSSSYPTAPDSQPTTGADEGRRRARQARRDGRPRAAEAGAMTGSRASPASG